MSADGYGLGMLLGPGEPVAGPWRVERLDVFARSQATETAVLFGDFLRLRAVTDKGVCAPRGPRSVRKVSHQVHHRA